MASTKDEVVEIRTNGHIEGVTGDKPPTTTISTIAVQSGNTRIVIALLQSKEWIQLKIQEMHPAMTDIGGNLDEASEIYQQHEKVLEKLQTKQSPVEELLRQADELIATQKPRGEVYSAMAENLGLAWKDLNAQLEQRRQILEHAVAFFARSKDFSDTLDRIQKNLTDNYLPESSELCATMLQRHQEERKVALSCSMHMLKEGQQLLESLCEVATHSMGDSRPFHMQHAARQTSTFVERQMECLHDRWRHLESLWHQRKLKLEQCLKKCQFLVELSEIHHWLTAYGSQYLRQQNLGDSAAGAEIFQHEHSKIERESKEKQDVCLKLVKLAEQLALAGNYAGEELKAKAYEVLSECSELVNVLECRNLLLSIAVVFFNLAQTALNKLDQIEIQLTTGDGVKQKSQLSTAIEDVSSSAIVEGHNIINRVGSHEPGVQGVSRKVAELEERKKVLLDFCRTFKDEDGERMSAFRHFNNNYNLLLTWITNNGQGFLQRNRDMGINQASAKLFVEQHESLQNDLHNKGIEVEALLGTVPMLVQLGGTEAQEVVQKSESLREMWTTHKTLVEKRLRIALCYLTFHRLAAKVNKEFDELDSDVTRVAEGSTSPTTQMIEEKFLTLQQEILQLRNSGRNFLVDAQKVIDPNLNVIQASGIVQNILDQVETRKTGLSKRWSDLRSEISSTKESMMQWEYLAKDVQRVINSVNEIETKLFPVLPKDLNNVESIIQFLESHSKTFVSQTKTIQLELENVLRKLNVPTIKEKQIPDKQKTIEELQRKSKTFQKKTSDYTALVGLMTTYFGKFSGLDKIVVTQEFPRDVARTEALIREHESCKPKISDLLKAISNDADRIIRKINETEPPEAAIQDKEKINSIYHQSKSKFELAWEERKHSLDHHLQMCMFNNDIQQINKQIDDLNAQLALIKQNYGDSLPNAVATSQAFIQFEKTIEVLQIRIQNFVSTAEKMMKEKQVDPNLFHREIQIMQNKWSSFRTQVTNNRYLIDLSVDYFKLVEESEVWLKDCSQLLISIGRKSSECKNVAESDNLRKEISVFLDRGQKQQEERLKKLSTLSIQLYGSKPHPVTENVVSKNKDMLQSFSVISNEISIMTETIRKSETIIKEKEAVSAVPVPQKILPLQPVPVQKEKVQPVSMAYSPPKFVVLLKDAEVSEGTRYVFECKVEGNPTPQIQWFKDGILSESNLDYHRKFENGICTLTIEETFSEDSATFTCRATNPAGVAETHGKLFVKESRPSGGMVPPSFIKEPSDATVVEGKSHQFECQVAGNPLPVVSWFKEDLCIDDDSNSYTLSYNDGFCKLCLKEVGLEHSGRYTCRAVNEAGQATCTVGLNVQTSLPTERPRFVTPLSNVMARAGQKLRLECAVTGQPEPDITWIHNTKAIKETRDIKIQFDGHKATLVITEAFPKDAGSYTVIAKNKIGEDVSTCNVSVKGRLPMETSDSEMASDIEPAKPLVKQHLIDQTVTEGDNVRMDTIIVGQPEPEVIWYHNGKPVKESNDFQLLFEGDRCTLVIKIAYMEDAGSYRCVAINSGGEASSQCQLSVQSAVEAEDKKQYKEKEILLSVEKLKPPHFVKLLKDCVVAEDQSVKLECQVQGEPEITTKWCKDDKEIQSTEDCKIAKGENGVSSLTIARAKSVHQGTYSVLAQNEGGQARSFCDLTVTPVTTHRSTQAAIPESPPTFIKNLEEQRVLIGQTVRFDSVVTGIPKPQVRWNYQGKRLVEDEFRQIGSDGDQNWLSIPKVGKDHSGRYSVVAENNCGISTSSALLHVEDPIAQVPSEAFQEQIAQSMVMSKKTAILKTSTISSMSEISDFEPEIQPPPPPIISTEVRSIDVSPAPVPPKFIKPVSPGLFTEGDKIVLEGHIQGSPEPVVKWLKDGVELHSEPRLLLSYLHGHATLTIAKSVISNTGKYSCVATNVAGRATSMAEVIVKPHLEPPKFLKRLKASIIKSGAPVELEVEISGIPKPEVKWYRNNSVLQSSPDFRISSVGAQHFMSIPEAFPEDSGTFMVKATNAAGEAKCIAELIVEEERSPEVEKIVSYQEMSSVQQKKEMFTKISFTKSADVETAHKPVLPLKSEVPQPSLPAKVLKPQTPSPPPIPAVSAKVWSQTKPEPLTPKIAPTEIVEDFTDGFTYETPIVEEFTKQDESIIQLPHETKMVKEVCLVQNGIDEKHATVVSEIKTEESQTFFNQKSTTQVSATSMNYVPAPSLPQKETPVWKPLQQVSKSSIMSSKTSSTISVSEPAVLASADITHLKDTEVTPILETEVVRTMPQLKKMAQETVDSLRSQETSYTERFTMDRKEIVSSSKVVTETLPKPIIKKETHADGLKPKKEVVIEEEPVVAAEVKPPVFSKVRRTVECFWKIA